MTLANSDSGPRRKASDYRNYPKSGQFRFHGAAKDYMRAWDDFLAGRSDVEPPEFWNFVEEWEKQFELFTRTKRVFGWLKRPFTREVS